MSEFREDFSAAPWNRIQSFIDYYVELINLLERGRDSQKSVLIAVLTLAPLNDGYVDTMLARFAEELMLVFTQGELLGRSNRDREFLLTLLQDEYDIQMLCNKLQKVIRQTNAALPQNHQCSLQFSYVINQTDKMINADQCIVDARNAPIFSL